MTDNTASQLQSDPLAIARLLKNTDGTEPKGLPPVHLWNPPYCGEIDMEIRQNGQWFYLGTPIERLPLVKLFSSVLRHDDDGYYYLVTPVERVRIRVEDAPFVATTVERHQEAGVEYLRFTMQTGDVVVAGKEHPLRVDYRRDEPRPYLHVRDRLEALVSRNVYYQLVEWGEAQDTEEGQQLMVSSAGQLFEIGRF